MKLIIKFFKMKKIIFIISVLVCSFKLSAQDPYVGEIRMVSFNFAPLGWALCNGQLLNITQYQALYALIGNTYGGDGKTTFALPDLRGRVAIQPGLGLGLTKNYSLGEKGGTETNTLTTAQLPAHNHAITVTQPVRADEGNSDDPTGKYPASAGKNSFSSTTTGISASLTATAANTGSGQSVNNIQPYLGINFIIAVEGIFPPRP